MRNEGYFTIHVTNEKRHSEEPLRLAVWLARADAGLADCPIKITCVECRNADYYCAKKFVTVQAK